MTTTIMRDSIVGDAWIRQTQAAVPIARKMGSDGQPTGDIITGPVRLAFVNIEEPTKKDSGDDSFNSVLLFPPQADTRVLMEEYYAYCGREFANHYDAQSQQYSGLHSPFHNQSEKLKYSGYTPDCMYITSGSQYRPSVCDIRLNPIIDLSKLYAGVWAICAVKPYAYGKNGGKGKAGPMKKGIGFGLQSVMIIGDDTKLAGSGPDAKEMFAGVNVSAPIVAPSMVAGMPGGAAPPPPAGIPGYTMPGGGAGAMPGFSPPPMMPAGYAGPPASGVYAPPATLSPADEELAALRAMGLA